MPTLQAGSVLRTGELPLEGTAEEPELQVGSHVSVSLETEDGNVIAAFTKLGTDWQRADGSASETACD